MANVKQLDPIWWFLSCGALLYVLAITVGQDATLEQEEIMVSDRLIDYLHSEFSWLEGREPTKEESRQLVDEWIEEEILFRQALASGLHRNDSKTRQRLSQMVRQLWSGQTDEPTDAELLNFYLARIQQYHSEPRFSFDHLYFSQMPADADQLLVQLRAGQTVTGEPYWLGQAPQQVEQSVLKLHFGGLFYRVLDETPINRWQGPIDSPHGVHYVRVLEKFAPEPIPYELVQQQVRYDWQAQQQVTQFKAKFGVAAQQYRIERNNQLSAAADD